MNGLAPLSAKGSTSATAVSDNGLVNYIASCPNKNGAHNNASPCKGGSAKKRGAMKESPSQGLGGVLCPDLE